jgi:hypothetical protein
MTASSPPLAINGSFLFQFITFTSLVCASVQLIMLALAGGARISQILMLLSTPQDAKTVAFQIIFYWLIFKNSFSFFLGKLNNFYTSFGDH